MKTEVKKVNGGYVVQFTHGVQTFTLHSWRQTKKEAELQKEMLDKCFESQQTELKPSDEDIEKSSKYFADNFIEYYPTNSRIRLAYQQGAKDARDGKISPQPDNI